MSDVLGQNIVRVGNTGTDVVNVAGSIAMTAGTAVIGSVNVSGVTPVSAPVASSVFGIPVYIAGGQSINNPVQVSISVSAVLGTVNTVNTLLGTVLVTQAGPLPPGQGYVYFSVTANTSILSTMTLYTMSVNENYTVNVTSGYTITRPILLQYMTVAMTASSAANILTIVIYVTTSGVVVSTAGVALYLTTLRPAAGAGTQGLFNFFTSWSSGLVLPSGGVIGVALSRSATLATNSVLVSVIQIWAQRL